ncbi:MAG: PilZ domain-containing protein [Spirochaetales bacterium]|nr:PilZ domain-containing protein [Spirochaetales bacterium]
MSILIQTTGYLAPPDRTSIIILVIIIIILILTIVIGSIISGKNRVRTSSSKKKYNKFIFERMAKDVGFSKNHLETLKKLIVIGNVRHPLLLFTNSGLLDNVLKKGISSIERQPSLSEEERMKLLNTIYEIKQIIDYHAKTDVGLKSTFLIKPGQLFTLHTHTGDQFHTKLISNHSTALICAYPIVPMGKEYLFKKSTKITAFFWRDGDSGYSFPTKLLGYDKTKSIPSISLQHSKNVKREQHRKFSRKPLKKSCFIYPLQVVNVGTKRRPRKKVEVLENKRNIGVIFNISVGGCRVGCAALYKKGTYVKIDFDIKPKAPVSAMGKIQSVKRRPGAGVNHIIHVKFVKLSVKSRNNIYSHIYNYM